MQFVKLFTHQRYSTDCRPSTWPHKGPAINQRTVFATTHPSANVRVSGISPLKGRNPNHQHVKRIIPAPTLHAAIEARHTIINNLIHRPSHMVPRRQKNLSARLQAHLDLAIAEDEGLRQVVRVGWVAAGESVGGSDMSVEADGEVDALDRGRHLHHGAIAGDDGEAPVLGWWGVAVDAAGDGEDGGDDEGEEGD